MDKVCFGIDIGGTAVKVGLFSDKNELIGKWEFPTRNGKDYLLQDIADFIDKILNEKKISKENVLGVGIGVPGPVKDNGEILKITNLDFGNFNMEETFGKMTGYKVKVANDANIAALGEQWQGAGKGYQNMVLVTLGTGVGGGIILNGTILAGSNGAGGEIGHILLNPDEKDTCGCGKHGCLEQYASATGIVKAAKRKLESAKEVSALRDKESISAKDVFDYAKSGDALAMEVVDQCMNYLGVALADVAQVIDPEAFVIGGGVSKAGEIITEITKKYYEANVMDALKNKEFKLATLGNDAGIYGAARLILA